MLDTHLVVCDDAVFDQIRNRFAGQRRALVHVRTGMAALRWLAERTRPTVVVVDLPMADMSAGEFIASVQCEMADRVAIVCIAGASVQVAHPVARRLPTVRDLLDAVGEAQVGATSWRSPSTGRLRG